MSLTSSSAGLQFENKVRGSLKRIGFKDVDGGASFTVGGFQVDAVGGWDDVLLVVEATQTTRNRASIRDRIVELRGKVGTLRGAFRKLEAYSGYRRFEFSIVSQGFDFTESDQNLANSDPKVHILDYQVLEYYVELASTIGKQAALYNILGELEVSPRDISVHRTPAFKVDLSSSHTGYLFFSEPQKLLEIAYVARRETGRENYYQRMVTASRLKSIGEFTNRGGIFPNNIILAFETKPQFRPYKALNDVMPKWLECGDLQFPKSYRSAWIIDGQHRLYAFGGDQPASRLQKLPVFAFEPMEESKQASFFIEINKEQKPVSPDLIWDLEADLRPESPRGRIALTVKHLNEMEPLRDRIYYPLSGGSARGKIKISSICNDIDELRLLRDRTKHMMQSQRNPLVIGLGFDEQPKQVSRHFASFLQTILQERNAATYRDSVILRPGGITLVLNVYEQVLILLGERPQTDQIGEYAAAFVLALEEIVGGRTAAASFVKNHLTSYAQRREVIAQIINNMRGILDNHDFGRHVTQAQTPIEKRVSATERRLADIVASTLGIQTIKDLKQKAPESVWRKVQRLLHEKSDEPLHSFLTLGEVRQIMQQRDNRSEILSRLVDVNDTFSGEEEVFVALDGLIGLRNALQHGRKVQNRKLGEAYLSAFERVLDL